MKRTIYLPDHLAEQIDVYLDQHPDETLSSLVQDALELKLAPKDLSQLLSLAGIVQHPTHPAADQAEDRLMNIHSA
jgi:metal-responsive CopG/Arc/MetJ family transcriptional regulator